MESMVMKVLNDIFLDNHQISHLEIKYIIIRHLMCCNATRAAIQSELQGVPSYYDQKNDISNVVNIVLELLDEVVQQQQQEELAIQ
eukprot:5726803-Ditylum_brightwellii.AAC.1